MLHRTHEVPRLVRNDGRGGGGGLPRGVVLIGRASQRVRRRTVRARSRALTRTRAGASDRWRRPPRGACEVTRCRRAVLRFRVLCAPRARSLATIPCVFRPRETPDDDTSCRRRTPSSSACRESSRVNACVRWCAYRCGVRRVEEVPSQITVDHPSVPSEGERDMRI